MITFTKEQMTALAPYEVHFDTAVRASWTRYPGLEGLQTIHRIFSEVTGNTIRLNPSCGTCVLNLVRDCGKIYYDTKKAKEVAVTQEGDFVPIKKVAVKTTTRKKKSE